jgi:hypothetical protein
VAEVSDKDDIPLGEMLEQLWADMLTAEATARSQLHARSEGPNRRVLSEGYELVGLMGEGQFAKEFHQPLDLSLKVGGDAGYDFTLPLRYTVDVKCFRKPLNLIHEQGRVRADIYVLAEFIDEPMRARLLGWEWGRNLAKAPVRDFGHGVINHYIPTEALRPIEELLERTMHLR